MLQVTEYLLRRLNQLRQFNFANMLRPCMYMYIALIGTHDERSLEMGGGRLHYFYVMHMPSILWLNFSILSFSWKRWTLTLPPTVSVTPRCFSEPVSWPSWRKRETSNSQRSSSTTSHGAGATLEESEWNPALAESSMKSCHSWKPFMWTVLVFRLSDSVVYVLQQSITNSSTGHHNYTSLIILPLNRLACNGNNTMQCFIVGAVS